jgi:hypothetical protein
MQNISYRLYGLLLFAYPPQFRRRFGNEMLQVFRDCCRAHASRRALLSFWLRTLADLLLTVAHERTDRSEREGIFMNNRRRDAFALLGCIGIIAIAFVLLSYGRRNEVSSILAFGYILDALIMTGVVGNFIVFLLIKTTSLNPFRAALWTFAIVHAVPVLFLALVVGTRDPRFSLGSVIVGYVVSFLIWVGLHWGWHLMGNRQPLSSAQ